MTIDCVLTTHRLLPCLLIGIMKWRTSINDNEDLTIPKKGPWIRLKWLAIRLPSVTDRGMKLSPLVSSWNAILTDSDKICSRTSVHKSMRKWFNSLRSHFILVRLRQDRWCFWRRVKRHYSVPLLIAALTVSHLNTNDFSHCTPQQKIEYFPHNTRSLSFVNTDDVTTHNMSADPMKRKK